MPKAVRFNEYGDIDVLRIVDVDKPSVGRGQVLVRVKAAGINPGEAAIRSGKMHEQFPATFPSGEGSDFAGIVEEVGEGVAAFARGDEVIGFTNERASHAELVLAEVEHLVRKPSKVPWEQAGALFVAGTTAFAAIQAVGLQKDETLVVSAAAGGVGSVVVQLGKLTGAKVIGLAGKANRDWLERRGVTHVLYGDGAADRIRAAVGGDGKVDAFIDTFGGGYVELALELGVKKERINTSIDFAAAEKFGVQTKGTQDAATAAILSKLAELVNDGRLEIPIAKVFPLDQVQDAYRELEQRHTHGKIVLTP